MRKLLGIVIMVLLTAICSTAFGGYRLELTDTQQIPENRLFLSGYASAPFEGKIVLSDIRGSKVSSRPWITFYAKDTNGKTVKFQLQFADGNLHVLALYDGGTKKGLLDRKYLLRENLPVHDKWRYHDLFTIEVVDGQAVLTLGSKSYTWPGISSLTGEMQVARVSGKLEIYNYVWEE